MESKLVYLSMFIRNVLGRYVLAWCYNLAMCYNLVMCNNLAMCYMVDYGFLVYLAAV